VWLVSVVIPFSSMVFVSTESTGVFSLSLHDALPIFEGTLQAGTSAVSDKLLDLVGLGGKSAADKGKYTRDYLAAAFPELNAWERDRKSGSAGMPRPISYAVYCLKKKKRLMKI